MLCPTPIGNLEDITLRALRLLREADVVYAEDTRRTRILLQHYGLQRRLESYHKWNTRSRQERILADLAAGRTVLLVSDAGTPALSDPGEEIVRTAIEHGFTVEALPGPQAILPALTASGLPTVPFYFGGFLPRSERLCRQHLQELSLLAATLVFFESPRRVGITLRRMLEVFGPRPAVLARELTKVHEQIVRGTLAELSERVPDELKGECVLLVAGARRESLFEAPETFVAELRARGVPDRLILERGLAFGLPRNALYDLLVREADGETKKGRFSSD